MGKKVKTSVSIDDELWKEWLSYVVKKRGTTKKASAELENALREYMKNHP